MSKAIARLTFIATFALPFISSKNFLSFRLMFLGPLIYAIPRVGPGLDVFGSFWQFGSGQVDSESWDVNSWAVLLGRDLIDGGSEGVQFDGPSLLMYISMDQEYHQV